MNTPYFLERLGLDTSAGERDVRRAYARGLKQIDQELDPEGFQHLRECYEHAQVWARHRDALEEPAVSVQEAGPASLTPSPMPEEADGSAGAVSPEGVPPSDDGDGHAMPMADSEARIVEPEPSGAQQLLAEFLPRLYALAQSSHALELENLRQQIKACLADPRMISLDSSDEFERTISYILVQGWKPGHETLFVAALLEFNWEQDIHRLQRLGYVGDYLSHAIAERQHFFQQEYYSTEAQRKVIEMLRQGVRASNADLIKYQPLVEGLMQRYPHVLAIIAGHERAGQWLKWAAEVPETLRSKVQQVRMVDPVKQKTSGGGSFGWIFFVIFLLFKLISALSSSH